MLPPWPLTSFNVQEGSMYMLGDKSHQWSYPADKSVPYNLPYSESDNEGGEQWLLRVPRVSGRWVIITKKIFTNTFEVRGSLRKKLKECKKQKVGKCWLGIAEPMPSWPHHSCGYLHLTDGSLGPSIVMDWKGAWSPSSSYWSIGHWYILRE